MWVLKIRSWDRQTERSNRFCRFKDAWPSRDRRPRKRKVRSRPRTRINHCTKRPNTTATISTAILISSPKWSSIDCRSLPRCPKSTTLGLNFRPKRKRNNPTRDHVVFRVQFVIRFKLLFFYITIIWFFEQQSIEFNSSN